MSSKAYEIKQYLLNSKAKESSSTVAKKFNTSVGYVRKSKSEMKKGNMSTPRLETQGKSGPLPMTLDQELIERQRRAILDDHRRRLKELHNRYDALNKKFDEVLQLRVETDVQVPIIRESKGIKQQATAIIQFSDWHVEERIEKKVTRGLNEYNPEIARARARKLVTNTLKLIRKERQDTLIKNLVICLGGDFINNFLHEHDVQENFMSPIEATMFAKELLKEALLTIAEYSEVDKITLLCIRGNHGRLTKRMQSTNDFKFNLEAMLYNILKQELSDKVFEWYIPESELGYIDIYGKKIRAFHGHQISYQGGIGDLTIPLTKAVMRWDKTEKADYNLMHHYHRLSYPMHNCTLNGSLCGWNAYALSIGASYEVPMQSFQLLDKEKGFTVRIPIFCD